jgi:homogentisate 1,2-dioxygenase
MKTLLAILLLSASCLGQSVFQEGQRVKVRWHGRWRVATMTDNPRQTDPWTVVQWDGCRYRFKYEVVPLEDVRAKR